MGFSKAVQWWEEWHLQVLVLASLILQYFLYITAIFRRWCIPNWFRFIIWLAYLGSDVVTIYALAALFNRHNKQEWVSTHRDDASLEALWAPILLVHLGGVDTITAYNIEDNELWKRHVLIAVSQAAVAIYVFQKSWSGDKKLLGAAILIFVAGILKCLEKPVALKRASISSLMSIRDTGVETQTNTKGDDNVGEFLRSHELFYLFVDMVPNRISDKDWADNRYPSHDELRFALFRSFGRLYTKEQISLGIVQEFLKFLFLERKAWMRFGTLLRAVVNPMIFTALGLFHTSHREAYSSVDVKVTYTLLSCTAALEYIVPLLVIASAALCYLIASDSIDALLEWPDQIAQYNLIGYLARERKHWILMMIMAFLGCKEYLDQLWCMKPCIWSRDITYLVRGYIKAWKKGRSGAGTNRAFNDNRGHWILKNEGFGGSKILWESLRRPYDESVLIWHLATEFCYLESGDNGGRATHHSRVISNYMAYLLFTNPEMLMTGSRPGLFTAAYKNLKGIVPLEDTALRQEELAKKIILKLKGGTKCGGVIDDAWVLSEHLMDLCKGDSKKMWKVIEGVWVEMLCFSAGRCRGYLHAKSLGKGGEYLSYIWLLLSCMGMETLADKMQRAPEQGDHSGGGGGGGGGTDVNTSTAPATTIIGSKNETTEPQEKEDSDGGAGCTAPATTIAADEKTDGDGGSDCTASGAPPTPIIGYDIV